MSAMEPPKIIPPFKADIVGSLLRPQAILEARAAHGAGNLTRQALWDIERAHISEAIALQKGVGLKVCTDGEYHRRHWFMDFVERIEGVAFEGGLNTTFQTEAGPVEFAPPRVVTARSTSDSSVCACNIAIDLRAKICATAVSLCGARNTRLAAPLCPNLGSITNERCRFGFRLLRRGRHGYRLLG
jgi:hypothetical protein